MASALGQGSSKHWLWQWLGFPVLVLSLGFTLSNLLRTMPAIASDVIAGDLLISTETVASLVGAYHFAFAAGQIPVGVALDRYGVRKVSVVLLIGVVIGALLALWVQGPTGFLMVQIVLGLACCGMLLAPMTLVAKTMPPAKFALWSGLVQGIGNAGMLLSASPLAWLIEHYGWRSGFVLSAGFALLLVVGVLVFVPHLPERVRRLPKASLAQEAREVVRIGRSPVLRAIMVLAFVSVAGSLSIRGVWGGPWLMDIKGLDRIAAGDGMLPLTLALVIGPVVYGMLDRRFGHAAAVLAVGHFLAGLILLVLALSQTPAWAWLGTGPTSADFDIFMFGVFGAAIASAPLLFAMGRAQIEQGQAGKALAAINLSFFCGAAIIQAATGPVASWGGPVAVLAFVGLLLCAATLYFIRRSVGQR